MYKNFNHSLVCYGVGGVKFVGGIRGNLVSFSGNGQIKSVEYYGAVQTKELDMVFAE